MGALKSALWGAAAALCVLGAGYGGGQWARRALNQTLERKVARYGLHADARWVRPSWRGPWTLEGLRIWDDSGRVHAWVDEAQLRGEVIWLHQLQLHLEGSSEALRALRPHVDAEPTVLASTSAPAQRSLEVEDLQLRWSDGAVTWEIPHGSLSASSDSSGLRMHMDAGDTAQADLQIPRATGEPMRLDGSLKRFPFALIEGSVPLPSDVRLHDAWLSPSGHLAVERADTDRAGVGAGVASLGWEGTLGLEGVDVQNQHLATQALESLSLTLRSTGRFDGRTLELRGAELRIGALSASLEGVLTLGPKPELQATLGIPKTDCEALRSAVPKGMWTHVGEARLGGQFDLRVQVNTQGANDGERLQLDTHASCTFEKVPASADPARFRREFSYMTIRKEGTPAERSTGPGTPSWTPLDDIPDAMRAALLTSEDGNFYEHHGISVPALRRAFLKDMEARAFVQGASTLSMQLAKNVYLARTKTLGRKVEELLLATLLEHGMQKEELLELYLNVVEFGPDVYGIKDAAMHYFGREARELSVAECFFLVGGLPAPKRLEEAREKGHASPKLAAHLGFLLRTAHKRGFIDTAELARASGEPLNFWRPGMAPPEPHERWPDDPTWSGAAADSVAP